MINTRGRVRKDQTPFDYSHMDNPEYRDLREEQSHGSSINEGHASDIASKRAHQQFNSLSEGPKSVIKNPRNVNRQGQKTTTVKGTRGRIDKLMDSQEFNNVVNGFVGFLEELSNLNKKKQKTLQKNEIKDKTEKQMVANLPLKMKVREETEFAPPSTRKDENAGAIEQLRYEKNGLYRFKDDILKSREFLNIMKKDEVGMLSSNTGGTRANKAVSSGNKINEYLKLYPEKDLPANEDALKSNTQLHQLLSMRPDLLQSLNWSNEARNALSMGQDSSTVRALLEMVLTNKPPTSMVSTPAKEQKSASKDTQRQTNTAGLNRMHMEIERSAHKLPKSIENTQANKFKTPFGRASTHVALAYLIYIKSLDNDDPNFNKKIDPTYNARRLKEKNNMTVEAEYSAERAMRDRLVAADRMQLEPQSTNKGKKRPANTNTDIQRTSKTNKPRLSLSNAQKIKDMAENQVQEVTQQKLSQINRNEKVEPVKMITEEPLKLEKTKNEIKGDEIESIVPDSEGINKESVQDQKIEDKVESKGSALNKKVEEKRLIDEPKIESQEPKNELQSLRSDQQILNKNLMETEPEPTENKEEKIKEKKEFETVPEQHDVASESELKEEAPRENSAISDIDSKAHKDNQDTKPESSLLEENTPQSEAINQKQNETVEYEDGEIPQSELTKTENQRLDEAKKEKHFNHEHISSDKKPHNGHENLNEGSKYTTGQRHHDDEDHYKSSRNRSYHHHHEREDRSQKYRNEHYSKQKSHLPSRERPGGYGDSQDFKHHYYSSKYDQSRQDRRDYPPYYKNTKK